MSKDDKLKNSLHSAFITKEGLTKILSICLNKNSHIKFKLFITKHFMIKPSSVNSCTNREIKVSPITFLQVQFEGSHFPLSHNPLQKLSQSRED